MGLDEWDRWEKAYAETRMAVSTADTSSAAGIASTPRLDGVVGLLLVVVGLGLVISPGAAAV